MEKMIALASKLNAEQLKDQAAAMMENFSDEAGLVLNALLAALEEKISADEFDAFCEAL